MRDPERRPRYARFTIQMEVYDFFYYGNRVRSKLTN